MHYMYVNRFMLIGIKIEYESKIFKNFRHISFTFVFCKYKHYYSNIPICIHGIFYQFQFFQ